jgi:hypothetical protein
VAKTVVELKKKRLLFALSLLTAGSFVGEQLFDRSRVN